MSARCRAVHRWMILAATAGMGSFEPVGPARFHEALTRFDSLHDASRIRLETFLN